MSSHRHTKQLVTLVEALKAGTVDPTTLSWRLRRKVIQYYMEEHSEVSCRRVAEIVGCSHSHVIRTKQGIASLAAYDLDTLDVKKVAANLKLKKEELQRRAMGDRDWATAWKIECDYVDRLQAMGYILLAPHRVLNLNIDLEGKLKDFFQANGVLSAGDFFEKLKALKVTPELEAGSGGNGGSDPAAPQGSQGGEGDSVA
jgi:hypothetical protein